MAKRRLWCCVKGCREEVSHIVSDDTCRARGMLFPIRLGTRLVCDKHLREEADGLYDVIENIHRERA
jgi:hypothetical protein